MSSIKDNPADYTPAQNWAALRLSWRGYKIAKVKGQIELQKEYARRIRTLQTRLGKPQSDFEVLQE